MDDFSAYYAPPIHHPYYQPPPPPPPGTSPAVQPQIVAYAPPIYPHSSHDQVRTLFVAGLPDDIKPRELYNLFRECPGYQSSNLRPPTSSNNQVRRAPDRDHELVASIGCFVLGYSSNKGIAKNRNAFFHELNFSSSISAN